MFAQGMFKDVMLKAYSMSFYGKRRIVFVGCQKENAQGKDALFFLFLHDFITLKAISCISPEILRMYFVIY